MFEAVELEGNYLQSRNNVRRIGTEERPEWGASPAKPSKLSELKPREKFYILVVRTESLAGCISGFAVDLSALSALSRLFVCARCGSRDSLVHPLPDALGIKNSCARLRDDCADVFATGKNGT